MKQKVHVASMTVLLIAFAFYSFAQDPGSKPETIQENLSVKASGLEILYSFTGKYALSADGAGSVSSNSSVRVEKPNASATVKKAILMGVSDGFSNYSIPDGCITLQGAAVNWDATVASSIQSWNHCADVTAIVAPIIDPLGAGIHSLAVFECVPANIDGVALLVVFDDPLADNKTLFIFFGATSTTGDEFNIYLAETIDPADPASIIDMGLGISFGFQIENYINDQVSFIDVNGQRLTSSAGGQDDGESRGGALITVGGVGDSNSNPAPYAAPTNYDFDDELYNLLPFITKTSTNVQVHTINPSKDDNIFLAYFVVSGKAALEPIPVPVSDWALYLGILLMVTFMAIRFRRMI